MKNFVYFLLILIFISCSSKGVMNNNDNTKNHAVDTIVVIKHDTLFVVDTMKLDSLAKCLKSIQDSLVFYRDGIRYEDYTNARRIEKIKYYIKICENNSKNRQFFFGWIRRTMTE